MSCMLARENRWFNFKRRGEAAQWRAEIRGAEIGARARCSGSAHPRHHEESALEHLLGDRKVSGVVRGLAGCEESCGDISGLDVARSGAPLSRPKEGVRRDRGLFAQPAGQEMLGETHRRVVDAVGGAGGQRLHPAGASVRPLPHGRKGANSRGPSAARVGLFTPPAAASSPRRDRLGSADSSDGSCFW